MFHRLKFSPRKLSIAFKETALSVSEIWSSKQYNSGLNKQGVKQVIGNLKYARLEYVYDRIKLLKRA